MIMTESNLVSSRFVFNQFIFIGFNGLNGLLVVAYSLLCLRKVNICWLKTDCQQQISLNYSLHKNVLQNTGCNQMNRFVTEKYVIFL